MGAYFISHLVAQLTHHPVLVVFRIIWRRVSELFGARHWLQRAELRVKATLASPELKSPKDLQLI
jgi:hypothetical protein